MPEWLLQVLAGAGAGIGAYAAIRADLARIDAEVKHAAESANQAHRRIDNITERRAQ
jgi:outer membrane murein-binding lipoprotein Lpp